MKEQVDDFLFEVGREVQAARTKFPGGRITMIALVEEVGELARALMDEPWDRVHREAVQVACMAARVALDGDTSVIDRREESAIDQLRVVKKGREPSGNS